MYMNWTLITWSTNTLAIILMSLSLYVTYWWYVITCKDQALRINVDLLKIVVTFTLILEQMIKAELIVHF